MTASGRIWTQTPVVHHGEGGNAHNNENPCKGGPESERSYRWPPRPGIHRNSF
jgi:hypothetical protein